MCGLAGIFSTDDRRPVDPALLARMTDALSRRGPDGSGYHFEPGLGFGHRRLAIIDVAGGAQPLYNEDGGVSVMLNGEIYNFQALTSDLSARGHRFRTRCDAEAIVHGWEEWGPACLDRLNGMFAFALWDAKAQTLFLARDRLGEKPLYYSLLDDGDLIFASELKSLLCHPGLRRAIDPRAIEEYFAYGYIPDPRSIYHGVHKLPPAHYLLLERGRGVPAPHPYWDVAFTEDYRASESSIRDELIARLCEAVRMRLIADVPLGAFLSGGVDSSAVVAMMSEVTHEPAKTFSIGFGAKEFDESTYAAAVAARYRTDHYARQVDPDSFDLLDQLSAIYDEPFGDSSAIPTYRVSALARERVTVALSGDGGDELFAGYRRYRWHMFEERFRRHLPDAIRTPFFSALGALYPKMDWAPRLLRAKATLQGIARSSLAGYFASVSVCGDTLRRHMFSPRLRRDLQEYSAVSVLERHLATAECASPLAQIQYLDLKTYLPGDILTKVDRASMASSLEVRVPLLDHTFVEWTARLPAGVKLHKGQGKRIFKSALELYLPADLLYRPKQGFAVPLAQWFRGPLRQHLRTRLMGPALADSGLFDVAFVEQLIDGHQSGRWDHSAPLWVLLLFEAFLRHAGSTLREGAAPTAPAGAVAAQ